MIAVWLLLQLVDWLCERIIRATVDTWRSAT